LPCNRRCWQNLWPFGIFKAIWYLLWPFGIFYVFPVLVCCTMKYLATLLSTLRESWEKKLGLEPIKVTSFGFKVRST
jgi:hypothetical protein